MPKIPRKFFLFLFITLSYFSNAQWTQSNGPDGGSVHDVTTDGSTLYAAVKHDIYRSSDKGQT